MTGTMIYELRIYHCVSGQLPVLLKRFETTTLEIWKRHGIRQAGFWTVLVGEGGNQDLHYLLAWESLAERETKWNAFQSDPEWIAKRAESERDGPIVASINNMLLQPTAFSAVKRKNFARWSRRCKQLASNLPTRWSASSLDRSMPWARLSRSNDG
jgi:hypothetical protein